MRRETVVMIAAGAVVVGLGYGARSVFGIVLDPLSRDLGWPREVFSLSLGIQNIVWGLALPAFGALADRLGDRRALWLGFGFYLAGMLLSAAGTTPWIQHLGAGVLVGLGVAGSGFGLVLAAVGRRTPQADRARVMAITAALGSTGQMLVPLIGGWLAENWGWQVTLVAITGLMLPMALAIPLLGRGAAAEEEEGAAVALAPLLLGATRERDFLLLGLGFSVCGFHIGFMAAHLPSYVAAVTGSLTLGGTALAVIGGANIAGTWAFGSLAGHIPKPRLLSAIHAVRAIAIATFVLTPPSPVTVLVFAAVIGLVWLPTVPLTSALVATLFGPKHLATLYGTVFLAHQVGAFAGIWLGGRVFDRTGSYDWVWWLAVALALLSAIAHLGVRERRLSISVA